mgnify:CR=1 FL=1
MATVDINEVHKLYPGAREETIKGISCSIADGEFIVMVGPSGCGKSTLLRMVAGLERITAGSVAIDGEVVNDKEPKDRDIAMVFQNYALYPHMSVYKNMAYGLKISGMSRSEIDRRVKDAARILQLDELLERRPRQLSGGQRQRVAMGRAIVREPRVFLFDEPLSNLDAKLRVQMRVEIKKLQRTIGTTSLYVTHDQVEAMTMADRIIVMNAGVAEQIGEPLEVYENPASLFVAGFIGSPAMNFLKAQVDADGIHAVVGGGHKVASPRARGFASRPVVAGIRPEHLALATDADRSAERAIPVQVELTEALGADSLIHGRIQNSGDEILARLPGVVRLAQGDTIDLAIAPDELHLFDETSGRNIGLAGPG